MVLLNIDIENICSDLLFMFPSSWLVLRSQMKDPSYGKPKEEAKPSSVAERKERWTATREWCEDVDDWGDGLKDCDDDGLRDGDNVEEGWGSGCGDGGWISQPISTSFETALEVEVECSQVECLVKAMSLAETSNETFPVNVVTFSSYQGPYYPAGFISVVEDQGACTASTVQVDKLLKKYRSDDPNSDLTEDGVVIQQGGGKGSGHLKGGKREEGVSCGTREGEAYEKGVARHGDKTFQKFHKQLSKFPQQILRYS